MALKTGEGGAAGASSRGGRNPVGGEDPPHEELEKDIPAIKNTNTIRVGGEGLQDPRESGIGGVRVALSIVPSAKIFWDFEITNPAKM